LNVRTQFLLCTDAGLFDTNGTKLLGDVLPDVPIRGAAAGDGALYLICGDRDLWRIDGDGCERLVATGLKANCLVATGDGVFAGTADARLERVGSGSTERVPGFDAVAGRDEWGTPWGGPPDVRSLAVSTGGTVYADIHVGWIARSTDGGTTWEACRDGLEKDVHQVAAHPNEPNVVFAATARGFYLSEDEGKSFERRTEPMPFYYQRACICVPGTNSYLVTTSRGPHGQADAQVYRSEDSGATWLRVSGIPDGVAENIDTHHLAADGSGKVAAVVEGSQVYLSDDAGETFEAAFESRSPINAVVAASGRVLEIVDPTP